MLFPWKYAHQLGVSLSCTPYAAMFRFMQELVGHCLQLFQDNQTRIQNLENYLQQYGYRAQEGQVTAESLLELPGGSSKLYMLADSSLRRNNSNPASACVRYQKRVVLSAGSLDLPMDSEPENAPFIGHNKKQVHPLSALHLLCLLNAQSCTRY